MTNEQHNAIVARFTARAKAWNLKPGTKKFLEARADFFCGAMTALNIVSGSDLDTGWTISIMTGCVIEPRAVETPATKSALF